jgi:hypothetical protein
MVWLTNGDYNGDATPVGPVDVKLCVSDHSVHGPSLRRHLTDRISAAKALRDGRRAAYSTKIRRGGRRK